MINATTTPTWTTSRVNNKFFIIIINLYYAYEILQKQPHHWQIQHCQKTSLQRHYIFWHKKELTGVFECQAYFLFLNRLTLFLFLQVPPLNSPAPISLRPLHKKRELQSQKNDDKLNNNNLSATSKQQELLLNIIWVHNMN